MVLGGAADDDLGCLGAGHLDVGRISRQRQGAAHAAGDVVADDDVAAGIAGAFLDAVSPEVALIPVGLNNQYGHPADEVIQRLRLRNIQIYRSDLDGRIEITTDGSDYDIWTAEGNGT